jgi:hypothetical protein
VCRSRSSHASQLVVVWSVIWCPLRGVHLRGDARRLVVDPREAYPRGVQLAFSGTQRRAALVEEPREFAHRRRLLRHHYY